MLGLQVKMSEVALRMLENDNEIERPTFYSLKWVGLRTEDLHGVFSRCIWNSASTMASTLRRVHSMFHAYAGSDRLYNQTRKYAHRAAVTVR